MMLCSCRKKDLLIVYPADVARVGLSEVTYKLPTASIIYQRIGILIRHVVSSSSNDRQIPINGLNDVARNLMRPTAKDAIY
jgi:hypothetical protein